MNVLEIALTQVQDLVRNQDVTITNTTSQIVNGVSRPLAGQNILAKAHFQPLSSQEIQKITDGNISAQEYYRVWLIGDNLEVLKNALNSNKESKILWGNREFFVFSKQDWSLNGWIEALVVLRS